MGEAEAEAGTGTTTQESTSTETDISQADATEYWRRNVKLIGALFVVWFAVSFLAAIILARPLANIDFGGVPLSFWFAQQGSIIVFVVLIWFYVWRMNKLDSEFGVED